MLMESTQPMLLVRAEASPAIGTGHVMRMLALAQAWQDGGGRVLFIFAQGNAPLQRRLKQERCEIVVLDCPLAGPKDAECVIEQARAHRASWVAVDGYTFSPSYLECLSRARTPVLLTTDYAQGSKLPVKALLNQNPHARREDYAGCAPDAHLLLGLEYLLLRREFCVWQDRRRDRPGKISRVLVTLGGADPENVSERVVRSLTGKMPLNVEVSVLVGANNPHSAGIRSAVAKAGPHCRYLEHVNDMPALLAETDLAICAAGSTCWEMAFMGVPMLAIVLADNQAPLAAAVEELGLGFNLGWHNQLDYLTIPERIKELASDAQRVQAMSRRGMALLDGRGAERVAGFLHQQVSSNPLENIRV